MEIVPQSQEAAPSSPDQASLLAAIHRTLRGDVNAFQVIVDHYTPLLFSLAYRMTGSREDAQEAVQEIFLKAYAALPGFRIDKRFHPWIYAIALNYLRSFYRKTARRRRLEKRTPQDHFMDRYADGRLPDPDRQLVLRQAEDAAAAALLALRHEYRAVFILRAVEGVPFAEIAAMLDLPPGTVKTFFHRAKEKLADVVFREIHETGGSPKRIYIAGGDNDLS